MAITDSSNSKQLDRQEHNPTLEAKRVEVINATPIVVSGALTDAELRATPVPISGPLTDSELRATPVPVSGPLTDSELRATPVPVSGPLTDSQLRATPVPVSGPLTDAQLRASAVAISATALPLPTGAATETTVSAINTKITLYDTDIKVADVPNQVGLEIQLALTTTAVEAKVGASTLTNRKYVELFGDANKVKWGYTTACLNVLFKDQWIPISAGTNCKVYVKMAAGVGTVVVSEK